MYNRYIPQPDGSYRRNRMPDQSRPPKCPHPNQKEAPSCEPDVQEPSPPPRQKPRPGQQNTGVTDFLKNLLPKDFDTGDLLIVLLLLLMSGDCAEDQNSALLTLVLYLFL